jgi:hypothetical protein
MLFSGRFLAQSLNGRSRISGDTVPRFNVAFYMPLRRNEYCTNYTMSFLLLRGDLLYLRGSGRVQRDTVEIALAFQVRIRC